MRRLRKTAYLCRAALCKHRNVVFEWVHDNGDVVTAPGWQGICGGCGRGTFDMQFQKEIGHPEFHEPFSTLGA